MVGERMHLTLSGSIGNSIVTVTLEDVVHVENVDRAQHEHYVNVLLSPQEESEIFQFLCALRGVDPCKVK